MTVSIFIHNCSAQKKNRGLFSSSHSWTILGKFRVTRIAEPQGPEQWACISISARYCRRGSTVIKEKVPANQTWLCGRRRKWKRWWSCWQVTIAEAKLLNQMWCLYNLLYLSFSPNIRKFRMKFENHTLKICMILLFKIFYWFVIAY